MSTIVKISVGTVDAGKRAIVVSERIVEDGRERYPNGVDEIPANTSMDFLVHEGQSVRVALEDLPAEVPVADPLIAATEAAAVIA